MNLEENYLFDDDIFYGLYFIKNNEPKLKYYLIQPPMYYM